MSGYTVTGRVERFPQEGGWWYVAVPTSITEELEGLADRGLIAVQATAGSVTWDTSLLPKGDGTHFIALNARVRRANDLDVGDSLTVSFRLRQR